MGTAGRSDSDRQLLQGRGAARRKGARDVGQGRDAAVAELRGAQRATGADVRSRFRHRHQTVQDDRVARPPRQRAAAARRERDDHGRRSDQSRSARRSCVSRRRPRLGRRERTDLQAALLVPERRGRGRTSGHRECARRDLLSSAVRREGGRIASVSIIRTDFDTHSLESGEKYVKLYFRVKGTPADGVLRIDAPALAAQALQGHYMLFVIDDAGVPSVAKHVRLKVDNQGRPFHFVDEQ
ncbi:MAG: DUF1929 domain-containing protein [Acidobacteria bacterium]|nr:DUF1929 domain-containing protein [Acidobacteriota bacterium]